MWEKISFKWITWKLNLWNADKKLGILSLINHLLYWKYYGNFSLVIFWFQKDCWNLRYKGFWNAIFRYQIKILYAQLFVEIPRSFLDYKLISTHFGWIIRGHERYQYCISTIIPSLNSHFNIRNNCRIKSRLMA